MRASVIYGLHNLDAVRFQPTLRWRVGATAWSCRQKQLISVSLWTRRGDWWTTVIGRFQTTSFSGSRCHIGHIWRAIWTHTTAHEHRTATMALSSQPGSRRVKLHVPLSGYWPNYVPHALDHYICTEPCEVHLVILSHCFPVYLHSRIFGF